MSKISKIKSIFSISALAWLAVGVWLYVASPKIWYLQYNISKEIKENLDDCTKEIRFEHEDKLTTDIINFISWNIARKDLVLLLTDHGYDKWQLPSKHDLREKDMALHYTIWYMHEKLWNPRIKFRWDYKNYQTILENFFEAKEESAYEHDRPRYNFNTNTISIHNLDSAKLDFSMRTYIDEERKSIFDNQRKIWFDKLENKQDPQQILINNWIAELTHAFQNMQDGFIKSQVDVAKDFSSCGFDYDKTYYTPGMVEYQAHEIYEPEMVKGFIKLYMKYADLSDPEVMYKIAKFYGWYFDSYKDYNLSQSWLKKAAIAGKVEAANILANRAYSFFLEDCNDYFVDIEKSDTYLAYTIYRYHIASKNSDSNIYSERLIKLCLDSKTNIDLAIWECDRILNNYDIRKDHNTNISIIFHYMLLLYHLQWEQCRTEENK